MPQPINRPISREDARRVFGEVRETVSSGHLEYNVSCPFPHRKGQNNWKMYVNATTGAFHCADCGRSGSFWAEFTKDARRSTGRIAPQGWAPRIERVAPGPGSPQEVSPLVQRIQAQPIWEGEIHAPGGRLIPVDSLDSAHPAAKYLVGRGMDPAVYGAAPWRAMYCEDGFRFVGGAATTSGRLVVPFYRGGRLRGWTARLIDFVVERDHAGAPTVRQVWDGSRMRVVRRDEGGAWRDRDVPKYFHLPGMGVASMLYNADSASRFDTVWAFEGVLDAWSFGEDAVAYCGEFPSISQCRILSTWAAVRVGMDPEVDLQDPVKSNRFHKFVRLVASPDFVCTILAGGDPADLGRDETVRQILASPTHTAQ